MKHGYVSRSWALLAFFILGMVPASATAFGDSRYDAGPDPRTAMGRELIDINASIPFMPAISKDVTGKQKFRPAFGPIPWRMLQQPNSVKILFIGQDGTHIAEAAGRPATAGFGGRAQDLAAYFGVRDSAAFMNTYAFTIQGQYGAFESPVLFSKPGAAAPDLKFTSFVDNGLWLMTQDPASPVAQWRNRLIDWIIRNNRDSLRLIVLFGGAARDAAGTFVESHGGKVGTRYSVAEMATMQVPETQLKFAGANNEFPIPLTPEGGDLYEEVLGHAPDYSKPADTQAAEQALRAGITKYAGRMVFSHGGTFSNGVVHPAQIGGFDLGKMEIDGHSTLSLKGLKLSDGSQLDNDVLLAQLPHPSALSRLTPDQASESVGKALLAFKPYASKGWEIAADTGTRNRFAAGEPYRYSRTDIGPAYYDFGAPASRMVAVSDASRMTGNSNVIIFGTRERVRFDMDAIKSMTGAQPSSLPAPEEMYVARPRTPATRYVFDAGPGERYASLMKENLPFSRLYAAKPGKTWEKDGIDAFNIKSHPSVADFGHYRGTFKNPKALILADPEGYDDLITARALTGTRGQYLQGLMEDLGIGESYLVLKTVPYGMDGANAEEWSQVLGLTQEYRDRLLDAVLGENRPELIIADGPMAARELQRFFGARQAPAPVIELARDAVKKDFGIAAAGAQLAGLGLFKGARVSGKLADIPRSHLSFYARVWEGTSGDRVINASDIFKGKAFAEVAPQWAWSQKADQTQAEKESVEELIQKLRKSGLPLPGESMPDFLRRKPDPSSLHPQHSSVLREATAPAA